jgi:hypothetical protein
MADLNHSIQISAGAEQIYPLVATGAGLTTWWAEDVTERNGVVDLGFFNRNTVYRLRLVAEEPLRSALWECETGSEWQGTRLIFALDPAASATRLRFTHAGWQSETDYYVSNTTWGALMLRLKAAAEGSTAGPLFSKEALRY